MGNSKAISLLFGLIVGIISTLSAYFLSEMDSTKLISIAIISFASSTLLFALITEYLFDRKIALIYKSFEKIKQKEFETLNYDDSLLNSINPLKGINNQIYSYAKIKQLEIDELKRLEAFRRDFLQDVSHELKTPIFAAQGFLHTLIDGAIEDKTVSKKFLKKAAKSLDYLALLVRDLLTISQMETGQIQMKKEAFCVKNLIRETFDQIEGEASKKSVSLHFKDPIPNKKLIVIADYYRIYQVLKNLISNAIKYSSTHTSIYVNAKKRKKVVTVSVKDKGKGIPKNDRKRIFERFYRIDKSRSKSKGGTGLGLAIAKHIIEGHNTKMKLKSEVNFGSTFYFNLKLAPVLDKNKKIKKKSFSLTN